MALLRHYDWLFSSAQNDLPADATARLFLLDYDVQSAQIAFEDFSAAKRAGESITRGGVGEGVARELHYAKTFVCAMMRVGRVAKDIASNARLFGIGGPTIKLAWRKKSAFFETYRKPRDAIEHVFGDDVVGQINLVLLNLGPGVLRVTEKPDMAAAVSVEALENAIAMRQEIVDAVIAGRPKQREV